MKRLEAGTFRRLQRSGGQALLEVDAGELAMLLSGIDAVQVKRRKRYAGKTTASMIDSCLQP